MDLNAIWNSREDSPESLPEVDIAALIGKGSDSLVAKLRKRLLVKIFWALALGGASLIIALTPLIPGGIKFYLIGYTAFCYLVGGVIFFRWRQLPADLDYSRPVLPVLKSIRDLSRGMIRFEERAGAPMVLISPAAGAMMSMQLKGKSLAAIFTSTPDLILLGSLVLVLGPLLIWLSNWMNRKAFGKYFDKLDEVIRDLEAQD